MNENAALDFLAFRFGDGGNFFEFFKIFHTIKIKREEWCFPV